MSTATAFKDRIKELREHMQQLNARMSELEPTLNVFEKQQEYVANATCDIDPNLHHSAEFLDVISKTSGCIQEFNKSIESFEKVFGHLCGVAISETARIRENGETTIAVEERLTNEDISRYSRQLILPEFGVAGQLKIKQTAFLIVGMGGLGCPAAQYLLAAGCGRIGLVDYDLVERSNFHRQTLHTEHYIGLPKVESAKASLMQINPHCRIDTYQFLLNSENALSLLEQYDIVLDCTDNVATRYLLNDACVMLDKTLVSGSALQLDGQLTVYHYGDGPCYRCLFPVPPPPETVTNCGDGGVLGAVTGVIGSLQALEAIKVAIGLGEVLAGRLLIFDGNRCIFRNIKLRAKRADCDICSATPLITRLINYEQFCGMRASDKDHPLSLLTPSQRISVLDYKEQFLQQQHVLLDVRSSAEFEICQLPLAVNVPLKQLLNDGEFTERYREQLLEKKLPCIVYCRRGNDSQIAVQHLQNKFPDHEHIKDIVGGLHAWHYNIDKNFPIY